VWVASGVKIADSGGTMGRWVDGMGGRELAASMCECDPMTAGDLCRLPSCAKIWKPIQGS
jgi:hypothetical protein